MDFLEEVRSAVSIFDQDGDQLTLVTVAVAELGLVAVTQGCKSTNMTYSFALLTSFQLLAFLPTAVTMLTNLTAPGLWEMMFVVSYHLNANLPLTTYFLER